MRQVFTGWGVAVKRKAEKRAAYDIISAPVATCERHLIMWRDYYLCNYSIF